MLRNLSEVGSIWGGRNKYPSDLDHGLKPLSAQRRRHGPRIGDVRGGEHGEEKNELLGWGLLLGPGWLSWQRGLELAGKGDGRGRCRDGSPMHGEDEDEDELARGVYKKKVVRRGMGYAL